MVNFDVVHAGFYHGICSMKFFIVMFSISVNSVLRIYAASSVFRVGDYLFMCSPLTSCVKLIGILLF
jgi:hypothetical protein